MRVRAVVATVAVGLLLAAARTPEQNPERLRMSGATFAKIQAAARRFYNLDGEHRRPGWKQYTRWEWLARTRLDRSGRFSPSLNWKWWKQGRMRRGAGRLRPDLADWTFMGPSVLPRKISARGLRGMGRLNCIAFDPIDPEILWVGAPSGGLWRSADGGQTWATRTDSLPNIGVSDIVIDPDDRKVMYLALGDADAGDTLSTGVLKSTDGGLSWDVTGLDPASSENWRVHKLVLDPHEPDIILAATSRGVYRSTDAGSTWERTVSGYFKDIEVGRSDASRWYASRWGVGVYRSSDGGQSWMQLETGLPTVGFGRISLAVSSSRPEVVYAAYAKDGTDIFSGFGYFGLYRSADGGESWSLRSLAPNVFGNRVADPGQDYSLGNYAQVLEVSATDSNTVYLGSVNLWKSLDGGASWQALTNQGGLDAADVHFDHHELAISPFDPEVLFSCHDGGLHRSDDAGTTWTDLSEGLAIRQVTRLGKSVHDPSHFIIGAQDNGTDYFNGEWRAMYGGDGMNCFIDPRSPDTLYVSYQNAHVFRSDTTGLTWRDISGGNAGSGAWVTPFLMDHVDPSVLYLGLKAVYRSADRGGSWGAVSPQLSGQAMTVLAVAPSNPQCLMASDSRRMFRTEDGGSTWSEVGGLQLEDLITDIAYHPRNPDLVWLALGGYGQWNGYLTSDYAFGPEKVLHSVDGGRTWVDVTGQLPAIPVNSIAVSPASSGVYVGTDLGVLFSEDGGPDWQIFDNGLPTVIVTDLEIDATRGTIWAGTYGRGVWRSPLVSGPYEPDLYPPLFLSGRVERQGFPELSTRHILSWGGDPRNDGGLLTGYRLYRVEAGERLHIADFDSATFEYVSPNAVEHRTSYELTTVGATGEESLPLGLTLRY